MRAQLDGLQVQLQMLAETANDHQVASTALQHTASQLEHGLQGRSSRMDGLAAASSGVGGAA